jgi:hypothetical protein
MAETAATPVKKKYRRWREAGSILKAAKEVGASHVTFADGTVVSLTAPAHLDEIPASARAHVAA